MLQRAMHVFSGFIFVGLFWIQGAQAVSFERIDVASHMGEPFYAEVPLRLSDGESLAKTSVELGAPSDYRILEVYRDQVINKIRVDIVKDERGPRVKLSSEAAIDTAFFNLVLKVRYGRSTHYKKMPIFLEAASVSMLKSEGQPAVVAAPVNSATVKPETSDAFVTKVPMGGKTAFEEPVEDAADTQAVESSFKPYSGWARTSRYGPMVYGDTITVVAQRLRLDDKFTNQQVMVALFEKNKAKFGKSNINLIKAGSYLDVPTANEVSQISVAQAKQVISEQNKAWKKMIKQPKYAAVANAQKTRYTRRVRVGEQASGVASAPIAKPTVENKKEGAEAVAPTKEKRNISEASQTKLAAVKDALAQKDAALSDMQSQMDALKARLAEAEKKSAAAPVSVDAAALDAQNKRLEIVISRLKNQLEQARKGAAEESGAADWLMYALVGLGVVILGLIGAVVMLLRRGPKHPAEQDGAHDSAAPLEEPIADEVADLGQEAESLDTDATALMNADDFDMPTESAEDASPSLDDMFEDSGVEEIPDFTDDETGEMEAFDADADEVPDASVNYLEEADVYIRYGMEDEAEKQVKMALKLDAKDPAAHAKLIQVLRSKGDSEGEKAAMTAAKGALTGAALITFEDLLSSGESSAEASGESEQSIASLDESSFTGDDTGIVDFGEINFDQKPSEPKDVMEPELLDTGEMDFGEVKDDSDQEDLDESGGIDFTGIDFGESGEVDASDSIDFTEINLGDSKDSDVMASEPLDTGEVDFGELSADTQMEPVTDAMAEEALDTGALDFGDINNEVEIDAEPSSDAMVEESLDTGELDFGELNAEVEINDQPSADVMVDEALDTGELDFGDLTAESKDKPESSDDAVDFDFSEMGSSDTDKSSVDFSENDVMNDSIDLASFGIDFEDENTADSEESASDINDIDMDSTAAISSSDETMVVSASDTPGASDLLNDRDVERAAAEAEEEANAASVELDAEADDPFVAASKGLEQAESDLMLSDLGDDIDNLLSDDDDLLALNEGQSSTDDIALVEIDDKEGQENTDLESISLDLDALSPDAKSIEDDLAPEIEVDFEGLGTIGDDLIDSGSDDSASVAHETSDSLDLDDFDMGDLDISEVSAAEPSVESVPASDNFDATVILDKTQSNEKVDLDASLDGLNESLADETLVMDSGSSSTADEDNISSLQKDPMDSFDATTELDGLMNDLNGLLDEDEDKK